MTTTPRAMMSSAAESIRASLATPEPDAASQAAVDDRLRPVSDDHVHEPPAALDVVAMYVLMPINADGDGPSDKAETVRVEHQVWDAETNVTLCVAADEVIALHIVARLNAAAPPAPVVDREAVAREVWIGYTGNPNVWDRAKEGENEIVAHCLASADRILALLAPPAHRAEDGPADQWQDIATAPRDGPDIMVWGYDGDVSVVAWDGRAWEGRCDGFSVIENSSDFGTEYRTVHATHWQPLPAPPTPRAMTEGETTSTHGGKP